MSEKKRRKRKSGSGKARNKALQRSPNNIIKEEKRGRKKITIDYELAEKLVLAQCTMHEIAAALMVSERTLYRDTRIRRMIKTGRNAGLAMIRKKQFEKGVIDGDREMLKHLGRVYLGQKDGLQVTDRDGEPVTILVTFQRAGKSAGD